LDKNTIEKEKRMGDVTSWTDKNVLKPAAVSVCPKEGVF
jgi:hypothetical protein